MGHWSQTARQAVFEVDGRSVRCALAETPEQQRIGAQGLVMKPGEGLAFVYPTAAPRTFWMPATCPQALSISFLREGQLVAQKVGRPGDRERYAAVADLVIEEPAPPASPAMLARARAILGTDVGLWGPWGPEMTDAIPEHGLKEQPGSELGRKDPGAGTQSGDPGADTGGFPGAQGRSLPDEYGWVESDPRHWQMWNPTLDQHGVPVRALLRRHIDEPQTKRAEHAHDQNRGRGRGRDGGLRRGAAPGPGVPRDPGGTGGVDVLHRRDVLLECRLSRSGGGCLGGLAPSGVGPAPRGLRRLTASGLVSFDEGVARYKAGKLADVNRMSCTTDEFHAAMLKLGAQYSKKKHHNFIVPGAMHKHTSYPHNQSDCPGPVINGWFSTSGLPPVLFLWALGRATEEDIDHLVKLPLAEWGYEAVPDFAGEREQLLEEARRAARAAEVQRIRENIYEVAETIAVEMLEADEFEEVSASETWRGLPHEVHDEVLRMLPAVGIQPRQAALADGLGKGMELDDVVRGLRGDRLAWGRRGSGLRVRLRTALGHLREASTWTGDDGGMAVRREAVNVVEQALGQFALPMGARLRPGRYLPERTAGWGVSGGGGGEVDVEGEMIAVNGCTVRFSVPIQVRSGTVLQPSVVYFNGVPAVFTQASFDEAVGRATFPAPPLSGDGGMYAGATSCRQGGRQAGLGEYVPDEGKFKEDVLIRERGGTGYFIPKGTAYELVLEYEGSVRVLVPEYSTEVYLPLDHPALGASPESRTAGERGLWDNIHDKRERGESPASPGDDAYPDEEAWEASQR